LKEPPEHPVGFGIRVDVGDLSGIMQVGGADPPMRVLRLGAIQMGIAN
jgi:hypothetical protein